VLGWGAFDALGLVGQPSAPEQFLPLGPVLVVRRPPADTE
jgi:hypothetical protein